MDFSKDWEQTLALSAVHLQPWNIVIMCYF